MSSVAISVSARPAFDLSAIDFVAIDDLDVPAYEPTPTDEAWRLGFETELAGERAAISSRDGYTAAEHLAFANGQRAARERVARAEAPSDRPTPEALASMLRDAASHCGRQGGVLGDFLASLIRDAATDVEYYRAATWQEFSAREAAMIETLQRCNVCENNAYIDRM